MVIWNTKSESKNLILSWITVAMLFVLSIGGAVLSYSEAVKYYGKRNVLEKLNQDLKKLDKIIEDEKTYKDDLEFIASSLPKTYEDTARFISQLETRARENRIEITDVQLDKETSKVENGISNLKITQKIASTYQNTSLYLRALSKLPYHTSIEMLEMKSEGANVSATLVFRLFMQKI